MSDEVITKVAIAVITSLILGILTGVLLPALRLSRYLRRDLEVDAKVVLELPKAPQREFRRDMGARSMLLVGYSKFPASTRVELAGVLAIIALSALSVFNVLTRPKWGHFDGELTGQVLFVTLVQFSLVTVLTMSWAQRATARLDFLALHLEPDTHREILNNTSLTVYVMRFLTMVIIVGPLLYGWGSNFDDTSDYSWFDWTFAAFCFAGVLIGSRSTYRATMHAELQERIGRGPASVTRMLFGPADPEELEQDREERERRRQLPWYRRVLS